MYKLAAKNSFNFELKNEENTYCKKYDDLNEKIFSIFGELIYERPIINKNIFNSTNNSLLNEENIDSATINWEKVFYFFKTLSLTGAFPKKNHLLLIFWLFF